MGGGGVNVKNNVFQVALDTNNRQASHFFFYKIYIFYIVWDQSCKTKNMCQYMRSFRLFIILLYLKYM